MVIDQLQKLIEKGILQGFEDPMEIARGILGTAKSTMEYTVVHGRSIDLISDCNTWSDFTIKKVIEFLDGNPDLEDSEKTLRESIMIEDVHWDWMKKAILFSSSEYDWFFLIIKDKVEAVCVTYHPKSSAINKKDIFYVEYLSVAPWNRPSKLYPKKYSGVGTGILKIIQKYFFKEIGYSPGFSLLALPQAKTFYEHIGMISFPAENDGVLLYYEMDSDNASKFMEVKYA